VTTTNLDPITRQSARKDKAGRALWDAYERYDRRVWAKEPTKLVKQARDLAGRLEAEVFG
jgi:hypothetical protein